MTDMINHPPHYIAANGLEAIDVIEAFDLNYRLGSVVAYILRADRKGAPTEDMLKAAWFLLRELAARGVHYELRPLEIAEREATP